MLQPISVTRHNALLCHIKRYSSSNYKIFAGYEKKIYVEYALIGSIPWDMIVRPNAQYHFYVYENTI